MEGLRSKTACFSGHRKIPPEDLPMVKKKLKEILIKSIENGYRYFGAGGAMGFDTVAALTILELKSVYPDIKLILVLPCKNQTRGWKETDIQKYEWIKSKADRVVYTSEHYFNGCMQKRNRYLVDNSSLLICYYREIKGGTEYTIKYAKKEKLRIAII